MNRFKMLLIAFSLALAVTSVQAQDATPEPTAKATAEVSFPITLTHSLGTIEIPAPLERIVALGLGDIDTAYGLGYTPVAIAANPYAEDGLNPWLTDYADTEATTLLPFGDFSFEVLVDETEAAIESIRTDYPALEGKTFSLSYRYDTNRIASIYSQGDFAVQFMQSLGFELTLGLADLATQEGNAQAALSLETLQLIDADLVILAFGSAEIQAAYEANPLYQQLGAVQDGRVIVVDLNTVTQLRTPRVLGIPWVLDELRPGFETLAEAS